MRVPSLREWKGQHAKIHGNDGWRGLELKFEISGADESPPHELVIKEILMSLGPSQITEIWPRFAHRADTRGMGVRDLINKLESMPSVRKTRGIRWRYIKHH